MFIEFIEITSTDRLGRTWKRRNGRFKCDQCFQEYISGNNLSRDLKRPRNYCNKYCSDESKKTGGLSANAFSKTNIERYGVPAPAQNLNIRNKQNETNLKRYGSLSSFGNDEILKKSIETRKRLYGVEHSVQIPGVTQKIAITNLKRYGTINPMNAPEIMSRYDRLAMHAKCVETMRKNKTFRTSKPEQKLYELLSGCFKCVNTQITKINPTRRWVIDFHIIDIDVYVQLDGVYWHGLDRPIEIIQGSSGPRDKAIYKKWCDDREQDRWFNEHNMTLIRITDKQINATSTLTNLLQRQSHTEQPIVFS